MATFVARPSNGGLETPYRRIIFGMSMSDILQSIGLISGPWALPSSTERSFAAGNDVTCALNGVSLTLGSAAMQYYVCFLCFYFLCKLKYRMTDAAFFRKYERWAHILIVLYCMSFSVLGVSWGAYNPVIFRNFCFFATKPLGCRVFLGDQGDCDATLTRRVDVLTTFVVFVTFVSVAIGITVIMIMLTCYANKKTKMIIHNHTTSNKGTGTDTQEGTAVEGDLSSSEPAAECSQQETRAEGFKLETKTEGCQQETRAETDASRNGDLSSGTSPSPNSIATSFRREIMIQAALYVCVYALTNSPVFLNFIIIFILQVENTNAIYVSFTIFIFSFGGIFNIFVYTRPKVSVLCRKYPDLNKLHALWMVLKAGGELPQSLDVDHMRDVADRIQRRNNNGDSGNINDDAVEQSPSSTLDDGVMMPRRRAGEYDHNFGIRTRVQINSGAAVDGLSLSLEKDDVKHRIEEKWSYLEGGKDEVEEEMLHLNEANLRDFGLSFSGTDDQLSRFETFYDDSRFSMNTQDFDQR